MAFEHSILLTAPGGHVGSQLVPLLLQDNVKVVLLTSNADRLQPTLPDVTNEDQVTVEQGSISDPQWIESILKRHSIDKVFLVLTGTDELMVTLNFFDAMVHAQTVKHLVYLSASGDFVSNDGFRHIVGECGAMHVLVKPLVERKLLYSAYPWTTTVLGCTLFMDNDLRSKSHILEGFFDEPLGEMGVSRVSTQDIALAARNTLIDSNKWSGKKIMIGSKRAWTGKEIAKLWGQAVGREVTMCRSDEKSLDQFEDSISKHFRGRSWTRDLRLMYEWIARFGFKMSEEEYNVQVECLGRAPVSDEYESFVRETAKQWTSAA